VLVYAIALGAAFAVVVLTKGSFHRLGELHFKRLWMLFVGLGIQVALEFVSLPRARFDDAGLALLLVSYLLIIGFGVSNVGMRGIGVITVGIAMNAFVIALNQGMPARVPAHLHVEASVKHHRQSSDDIMTPLADEIVLRSPFYASVSVGDFIVAAGLVELFYFGSRPRRRRRGGRPAARRTGRVVDLAAAEREEAAALPSTHADDHALQGEEHARVVELPRY
jgi:hypothetical protein